VSIGGEWVLDLRLWHITAEGYVATKHDLAIPSSKVLDLDDLITEGMARFAVKEHATQLVVELGEFLHAEAAMDTFSGDDNAEV